MRDFHQVVAELRFNRSLNFADRSAENDFIEFLNHLSRPERTQGSALRTRRTAGMSCRQFRKIRSVRQSVFQIRAVRLPLILKYVVLLPVP